MARLRGELKELPSSCGGSLAVSLTVRRSGKETRHKWVILGGVTTAASLSPEPHTGADQCWSYPQASKCSAVIRSFQGSQSEH